MEPRLVFFDQMRTPEVVGKIGEINQELVALSGISTDWEKYIVEAAFIPAALVDQGKVLRPSLLNLAKTCQKFRRIFVGKMLYSGLKPRNMEFR